jgi:ATP synthase protein I
MPDTNDRDQLNALSEKIAAAKPRRDSDTSNAKDMSVGVRAGTELVTCIIAGTLLGWGLDNGFGTAPIFLIIFLLTGIGVGFYEVWRLTNNMGSAVGFADARKKSKNADENH